MGRPKCHVRRRRDLETGGIDVERIRTLSEVKINWIASGHAIGKSIIVATKGTCGVSALAKESAKWHAIISLEDRTQLPSARWPRQPPRQRVGGRDEPSRIDHQSAAHIVIRQTAG